MVISRLIYLIQLWGGCPGYLLNFLQVLQNRAAHLVCNEGKFTPIKTLLENCGWLSVRQLVAFHRVLLVFKIRQEGKPKYFVGKFTNNSNYKTRFLDAGGIKKEKILQLSVSKQSFVPSSIDVWNNLPLHLREAENVKSFKKLLKPWIKNMKNHHQEK